MAKVLRCADLMPGCHFVAEGKDVAEPGFLHRKIPASQDCDDRFLPARGEDRQLHLTPLNVKHRVRRTALDED